MIGVKESEESSGWTFRDESGNKKTWKIMYTGFLNLIYPKCQLKLNFYVLSYFGGLKRNIKQKIKVNNDNNMTYHYSN